MPNLTPNLGLKQPLGTESADIAIINENMGIIDATVAKKQQGQWIKATLLNGAQHDVDYPVEYMKDELGFVHFRGVLRDYTLDGINPVIVMPSGYRPKSYEAIGVTTSSDSTINNFVMGRIAVLDIGYFHIDVGATKFALLNNIIYYAQN